MFTRIGRTVSRHPVGFVVGWALLVVLAASLVFQGWDYLLYYAYPQTF